MWNSVADRYVPWCPPPWGKIEVREQLSSAAKDMTGSLGRSSPVPPSADVLPFLLRCPCRAQSEERRVLPPPSLISPQGEQSSANMNSCHRLPSAQFITAWGNAFFFCVSLVLLPPTKGAPVAANASAEAAVPRK